MSKVCPSLSLSRSLSLSLSLFLSLSLAVYLNLFCFLTIFPLNDCIQISTAQCRRCVRWMTWMSGRCWPQLYTNGSSHLTLHRMLTRYLTFLSICSVEDGTHMLSALSLRRFTFFSSCNSCWISLLVSCCWHINKVFETTATRVWLRLWAHNVHRMLSSSQKENQKKRWLKSFVQSRNIVVCLELMSMMLDRLCKHLSRKSWRVSLSSVNLQPTSSTIQGKWDLVVK